MAICGFGETQYSAVYKTFVEERIEAFCSLRQIDRQTIEGFRKSLRMVLKYAICYHDAPIAYHLSRVADAEQDSERAIRLRKEVVFWYAVHFVDTPAWTALRDATDVEIRKLHEQIRRASRESNCSCDFPVAAGGLCS
jgi:hypothetical protein